MYADDHDIIARYIRYLTTTVDSIVGAADVIGLEINISRVKYMFSTRNKNQRHSSALAGKHSLPELSIINGGRHADSSLERTNSICEGTQYLCMYVGFIFAFFGCINTLITNILNVVAFSSNNLIYVQSQVFSFLAHLASF